MSRKPLQHPHHRNDSRSARTPLTTRRHNAGGAEWALTAALAVVTLVLAWPVLSILGSWLQPEAQSWQRISAMAQTVLPEYTLTSLGLCLLVALGVASMGVVSAAAVTLFDYPGRKTLEWALLLPMAMPAYVVAYAYTDFFQFSGPLQSALRAQFGWQGALWPDVRSVWGAAVVFSVTLYPYVYLLVRTALAERAAQLMEAARLLGAPLRRRILEVALPLTRPAVAAGMALALMETLADYGVASYFGIQTFTAGIYKAWLVMDDRLAATQLATVLLVLVLVLLRWEHQAQGRARFHGGRGGRSGTESQPMRLRGAAAGLMLTLTLMPVVLGFVLPVIILLRAWLLSSEPVVWSRFGQWTWNSLSLGALTAGLAVFIALALAFANRVSTPRAQGWGQRLQSQLPRGLSQLIGLGYAIPGAVVVVGVLTPLAWLQAAGVTWGGAFSAVGALLTTTSLGLVWAYLVRFCSVALQSVHSGYARVPRSLDESARMLGVTGWALWRRVHLPLLRQTSLAAMLLVFVDVMKELPVTLVLRPFDSDTLAVVAYQLARDERLGEAALPALALVLVGLLPVALLLRTLKRAH